MIVQWIDDGWPAILLSRKTYNYPLCRKLPTDKDEEEKLAWLLYKQKLGDTISWHAFLKGVFGCLDQNWRTPTDRQTLRRGLGTMANTRHYDGDILNWQGKAEQQQKTLGLCESYIVICNKTGAGHGLWKITISFARIEGCGEQWRFNSALNRLVCPALCPGSCPHYSLLVHIIRSNAFPFMQCYVCSCLCIDFVNWT